MNLPVLNTRVQMLIEHYARGRIKPFSEEIGLKSPQKLNRIFHPDPRNNQYPIPSIDIVLAILNHFEEVSEAWLLKGKGPMFKEDAVMSPKDVDAVADYVLLHERELMENDHFRVWYHNIELKAENRLLRSMEREDRKR